MSAGLLQNRHRSAQGLEGLEHRQRVHDALQLIELAIEGIDHRLSQRLVRDHFRHGDVTLPQILQARDFR